MAEAAGFSMATLSKAAAGTRLPSLAVVQGYVRACGGDPGEWEARWKEAEAGAAEEAWPGADDATPPYRGLARFEPDDRELFLGRNRLVRELLELVSARRFAVVFGASGSGKSSLLRAGLIPRLREETADLGGPAVLRILTPGPRPATTYGHLLAPAEGERENWVVVDQFEEVFTLCQDREERARFIDLLLAARTPGSRMRVVIAVRADFYAHCAEHRDLADALRDASLLVGPMTADELREAVVKPAQAVGLLVERELTARIVEDVLDEPGGLPMFSHALLETWRRRRGRMLTLAAYRAAGGVRGAIAATAEEVFGQLSPEQARTARHLLLRMVEPGQGTPDTRRPLTRAELQEWPDPEVPVVVDRLTRARLLTADDGGVQLAHEALITCWPRLHGWIEQDRERLRHHRRLTDDARVWLEHDRDPGALYRGARLTRAEELFADDDGMLSATERAFLTAAREAREAECRAAARSARRSRALLATLSAVLAVALVAGLTAWVEHRDNQRRRTEAAARRIAEVADALRTTDPRTAQLLGVAAWRVAELPETRRALLGALAQPQTDTFTDPAPGSSPSRFLTRSGRTLLSADGGSWRTWDVTTHRRIASGRLPDGTVIEAGPDGRHLAIVRDDGVRLWDTSAGRWTGAALPADTAVEFGLDGRSYVESSLYDDRVRLRSTTDGTPLFETRVAGVVEPSADGRLLAGCPSGRPPRVWDTADHRILPGAWEKAGSLCDDSSMLVFGDSGDAADRFAVASDSGVHIWDATSGRRIAALDDAGVDSMSFSKDGSFLATADGSEIRVWRLDSSAAVAPAPVFRHSLNNEHLYGGLAWDADRPLLRYLEGGTVHTLDLADAVTSAWRADPLAAVLLSPDGRMLATAERTTDAGYRFQLRDTLPHSRLRSSGGTPISHVLRTLPPVPLPVSRDPDDPVVAEDTLALMAFSPDGGTLAYGVSAPGRLAAPQRFVLWDVARGHARTTLDLATPSSAGALVALALGPSGHTLYATRTPHIGELSNEVWDTTRHRRTAEYSDATGTELAIRPDGRLLVATDHTVRPPTDHTVRPPSGTVRAHNLVQGNEIGALAFAPDGSRLAAGDLSGRVTLWDGSLKHREGVLRNVFPTPLDDTAEAVSALAVSPDGRTLAVGGDAGTLQLWDIATRQPLGGPLTTAGDAIASLAFSPDSTTVHAAGTHVPLMRYTIDPARAVTQICARTGGAGLTPAQWHTYVPDAPYREVCGH
ncbi:WD40 repeat domain-containing protein [Streptomyces ipomoeae]|uniref:WD40 repeat domain-containing protein n=1 Tax=Streptomyces ipomoeae TaxID=103232 RepID=UPI001FD10082|nr:WD40 repeat domain-containing protein [Streptomyces ipomoeae]MDX2932883.1 WD40 repeat domain-containing protein [Streptomyces ipomoeae]